MTPQNEEKQTAEEKEPARPDRRGTLQLLDIIAQTETQQEFARELISAELARDMFDQDWRLAKVFASSGIFSELKDQTANEAIATAMTKIRMGRAWGINEADAMRFIFFQNGKPSIENELVAAKLQHAGWDWDIEWARDAKGRCTGCTLWAKKKQPDGTYKAHIDREGKPVSITFNQSMAESAMVWEKGKQMRLSEKWNFQSWPDDMYFSKAIARFKRRLAPGILSGAITRDEAEEMAPEQPERPAIAQATDAKTEALGARLVEQRQKKEAEPVVEETKVAAPAVAVSPAPPTGKDIF